MAEKRVSTAAWRAERQRAGIARAIALGTKFGAKAKLSPEQVTELRAKRKTGVLIRLLMEEYGISGGTVYKLLNSE